VFHVIDRYLRSPRTRYGRLSRELLPAMERLRAEHYGGSARVARGQGLLRRDAGVRGRAHSRPQGGPLRLLALLQEYLPAARAPAPSPLPQGAILTCYLTRSVHSSVEGLRTLPGICVVGHKRAGSSLCVHSAFHL
jgi:hypothetical protein